MVCIPTNKAVDLINYFQNRADNQCITQTSHLRCSKKL
jgi:hypothetical protein